MFNRVQKWLDDRTGWKATARRWKNRPVPVRGRVWQSLGFVLVLTLGIEFLTGVLVSLIYSPSTATAWGSVYYLSNHVELGWLIRGIHRFGAYAAVVIGIAWLSRLIFTGLFHRPREFTWWLALGVVGLILILGVTGNILPWDQRGYWAAVVETTITGGLPIIGPPLRRLIVGGAEIGNTTLTRIYALHVVILPGLVFGLGWLRLRLLQRIEDRTELNERLLEPFWPRAAFVNIFISLGIYAIVVGFAVLWHGYSLDAPADASSDDYPARPEWYFLPLYQLLRVFQGREWIATVVLPTVMIIGLFVLPLLDRVISPRLTQIAASTFFVTILLCSSYLTYQSLAKDAHSENFRKARVRADQLADRAMLLANRNGISPIGSGYILKSDPQTRGAELFGKKCQGCHNMAGPKHSAQWAPALAEYGSRAWIRGLLAHPDSADYFGRAPDCGGMTEWKASSHLTEAELDAVADYLSLFASTPLDMTPGEWLSLPEHKDHPGRVPYKKECTECHSFGDPADREKKIQPAPDLFAWGSDRWTSRMIREPSHSSLYGYLEDAQKMPAFATQLTETDLEVVVRFIRGQANEPVANLR